MHIVITGAGGFVGAELVRRLLAARPADCQLTLIDQHFPQPFDGPRIRAITGNLGAADVLAQAFATPADVVFHLASVPGALAERDYRLGYEVNLLGTLNLFDAATRAGNTPRIVFASSIAVYGNTLPAQVDSATPCAPALSYGAHKLAGELVLSDLTRRGMAQGVSLRLPGIVARPGVASGHGSAFMSAIIRAAAHGLAYPCTVSPHATCWWMSLACCIDNLLVAAECDMAGMPPAVLLPVLRLRVADVIAGLARRYGEAAVAGISYVPDARIEALFGNMPATDNREAEALGFRHDSCVDALIERARTT